MSHSTPEFFQQGIGSGSILKKDQMRKLTILLVEDDELSEKVTTFYLRRFGHEVDIAKNGYEAVSRFKDGKYDLILMDIQMPEMDGLQAVQEIRRIERDYPVKGHTIIIAITTNPDKASILKAGMDGYTQKPFSFNGLNALLSDNNLI
jgi:CheY-like chemotaxis protein